MTNESVFLTTDEASSLQAAVGRIISTGIRLSDSELQIPVEKSSRDEMASDRQDDVSGDPASPTT